MKKILQAALVLIVSTSIAGAAPLKKNEAEVVFKTDIQSKHCKDRVEKVIPFEKGVQDMNIKIPDGVVYVKYRTDKTSPDAIKKAIEAMGYAVEITQNANKQ
jgi:copper chaperone CopZ